MARLTSDTVSKAAFVASLLVGAFLYGFAAHGFGWFPASFLEQAWRQARVVNPLADASPPWAASRVYDRTGTSIVRPDVLQPGLTLISSVWEDFGWKPGLKLIDSAGRTVHEWKVNPQQIFPQSYSGRQVQRTIHGSYLFPSGDVLVNIGYTGTVRLDACGNVKWKLAVGSHHSISRGPEGSFWVPGSTDLRRQSPGHPSGFPGIDHGVYQDQLLRITPTGKVIEKLNVLDLIYDNELERHIWLRAPDDSTDITHLNDIEPLGSALAPDHPRADIGDLLISLRNLNMIAVLVPHTREIKWHHTHAFIRQHDPDWMEDGWVGVFDNNIDGSRRGSVLGGSRVVKLRLEDDSARVIFPTADSEPLYTTTQGNWQQLRNGNLLLTESRASRVVEVTGVGRTVWEWVGPAYEEGLVAEVYQATRHYVTKEEVASWPCSPVRSRSREEESASQLLDHVRVLMSRGEGTPT